MATFDYAEMLETVHELLVEFGREITLVKYDPDVVDNSMPWKIEDGEDPREGAETTTIHAVTVEPATLEALGIRMSPDEELLRRVNCVYIAEPGEDDPDNLETYNEISDGKLFHIEHTHKLKPAETTLLYYFLVRR